MGLDYHRIYPFVKEKTANVGAKVAFGCIFFLSGIIRSLRGLQKANGTFFVQNVPEWCSVRFKFAPKRIQRSLINIAKNHAAALTVENMSKRVYVNAFGAQQGLLTVAPV